MWKHLNGIMVDIATIAKSPDSAIMSIGAVQFDVDTKEIFNEFTVNLNFRDGIKRFNLAKDKDTIEWWTTQNAKELNKMTAENALQYDDGISAFIEWVYNVRPKMVWTRGGHFDIPILVNSIIKTTNEEIPWRFNICDMLTLQNAFLGEFTPGKSNLPLNRATEQAQFVIDFFNSLGE